jgi:hypothetical protein
MKITSQDRSWLKKNQPQLEILEKNGSWEIVGGLQIKGFFNDSKNCYYFGNSINQDASDYFFDDYFSIQIDSASEKSIPKVKDLSGKLKKISKSLQKTTFNIHWYTDGYICLAGDFDNYLFKESGKTLSSFIIELVIPFFYDQLFFQKFEKWPRGEYLHGLLGKIENFGRLNKEDQDRFFPYFLGVVPEKKDKKIIESLNLKKGIKGTHLCLCGSNRKIRNCHNDLFRGLWSLGKMLKKFNTLSKSKKIIYRRCQDLSM